MYANAGITVAAQGGNSIMVQGNSKNSINGVTFFTGLPTSCSGQSTGTIWNNSGVAGFCP
jgi:hypothetical protein